MPGDSPNASQSYWRDLAAGTVVAVHGFSSDIRLAKELNPKIAFALPAKGAMRWADNLVIPTGAAHPKRAHQFISFFPRPQVSAAVVGAAKVDTGNAAAHDLLPADLRDDPIVFPSEADRARTTFAADLGDGEKLWDDAWTRVRG